MFVRKCPVSTQSSQMGPHLSYSKSHCPYMQDVQSGSLTYWTPFIIFLPRSLYSHATLVLAVLRMCRTCSHLEIFALPVAFACHDFPQMSACLAPVSFMFWFPWCLLKWGPPQLPYLKSHLSHHTSHSPSSALFFSLALFPEQTTVLLIYCLFCLPPLECNLPRTSVLGLFIHVYIPSSWNATSEKILLNELLE